ncbi:MAG TPA: tRNA pseudouridine(38-40) synthase TruA [Candidatus Cybelea sp.]
MPIHLRLTVEYDGTEFCGFQWQPALRTVAGTLEAALAKLYAEPIKVTGAGRTDAGVHASGQVVSFAASRPFAPERLGLALNALLPRDCSVRDAAEVDDDFSARFSALERTYVYAVLNRRESSALLARYAYHVTRRLDLAAMRAAGACLVGEHDFRPLIAGAAGPLVRSIGRLEIEPRGDLLRIEVAANAFLRHMVRAVVGTLLECGGGRRRPEELAGQTGRQIGAPTAPAHGLFLAGVRYDGYDSFAEPPPFGRPPSAAS